MRSKLVPKCGFMCQKHKEQKHDRLSRASNAERSLFPHQRNHGDENDLISVNKKYVFPNKIIAKPYKVLFKR